MRLIGAAQTAITSGDPAVWVLGWTVFALGAWLFGRIIVRSLRQRHARTVTEEGNRIAAELADRSKGVYRSEHAAPAGRWTLPAAVAWGLLALAFAGLLLGGVWAGLALIAPEVLP